MTLPLPVIQQDESGSPPPTTTPMSVLGDLLDAIHHQVAGGLLYNHHRVNRNTARLLDSTATLLGLVDLLVEKDLIGRQELHAKRQAQLARVAELFKRQGMTVYRQDPEHDKYTFPPAEPIDCDNRIHLCKAACCKLEFALSRQDVEEGVVNWDFARPYLIRRGADGYCAHLQSGSCRCTVYGHRPVPCRAFDCRKDDRIWSDFDRRIVSPTLQDLLDGALGDEPEESLDGLEEESNGEDNRSAPPQPDD